MSKGGDITTGYKYWMGLHAGICHGPVDDFVEIRGGNLTLWSGTQTVSDFIAISAEEAYGGDKKEGGVSGHLDVMMGEPTQGVNTYLASVIGGMQTAYRGLLTVVFRQGQIGSNNPYPKPWSFRVRRAVKGWENDAPWYSAKAMIALSNGVKSMNPAHIVYETLTNTNWGMGYPSTIIDNTTFTAAADQLYSEGFGLCLLWLRQDSIESFLQSVMDYIGGVMVQSKTTGLFQLNLIRGGYSIGSLPAFTRDNVVELMSLETPMLTGATNEVIVEWFDPTTKTKQSTPLQSLGAIQAQGVIVSTNKDYPGICSPDLASRVCQRELNAASTPLKKIQLKLDRNAYALLPGGLFVLDLPDAGLSSVVFRVGDVDYGTITQGAITITALQDIFSLPSITYKNTQSSGYSVPDALPHAPTLYTGIEATYRDLYRELSTTDLAALPSTAGYAGAMVVRPTGLSINYEVWSRVGIAAYGHLRDADFCPTATLVSAIARLDTSVSLQAGVDLDLVSLPCAALLDGEMVNVTSLNISTGAATISRGCLDTVPITHAIGARIWFLDGFEGSDGIEYFNGEIIDIKPLTVATQGTLTLGGAPTISVPIVNRQSLPYPPGNFKINAGAYPASITGAISVSWSHRNRISQADQMIGTTNGNIGPESGVTYTITITGESLTLGFSSGVTNTSYSLTMQDEFSAGLIDAGTNRVLRSQGLAAVSSTESTNLDQYPSGTSNFYRQQFGRVNGGWLSFNSVVASVRGVYVDGTTGAQTVRTYDLVTNTRSAIVTLIPSITKIDPVAAAAANSSFSGWSTYWSNPADPYNGYASDEVGIFNNTSLKDRRSNPSHIVTLNIADAVFTFSAQTYHDTRSLKYYNYGLYVIQKADVVTGPMAITRTVVETFWLSTADQFDTLTGQPATALPSLVPSASPLNYRANEWIYKTGVIFGGILYMHYHRGTGSATTSGKTLDITNVVSSGHISYFTGAELVTKTYTITSGGVVAAIATRVGLYLADQLNGTQGFEVLYSTRQVWLVNSTTGAQGSLLGTLGYDPCTVYGDTVNNYIYILGTDGTLRKYNSSLSLLASIAVGTTDQSVAFRLLYSDIKESLNSLYVRYADITYEVKKDLSASRKLIGFSQTYPGYADPASTVLLMASGHNGLADESGIASATFSAATPRFADQLTVEVKSVRGSAEGFTKHSFTTKRQGMGLRMGESMGG